MLARHISDGPFFQFRCARIHIRTCLQSVDVLPVLTEAGHQFAVYLLILQRIRQCQPETSKCCCADQICQILQVILVCVELACSKAITKSIKNGIVETGVYPVLLFLDRVQRPHQVKKEVLLPCLERHNLL